MRLLTPQLHEALRANFKARRETLIDGSKEPDHIPLLKLFYPRGFATWLAVELSYDDDTLFGLADLGFGYPELGSFSLREIADVRLPHGLRIERDPFFATSHPLSVWADKARAAGSILCAERMLREARDELPS